MDVPLEYPHPDCIPKATPSTNSVFHWSETNLASVIIEWRFMSKVRVFSRCSSTLQLCADLANNKALPQSIGDFGRCINCLWQWCQYWNKAFWRWESCNCFLMNQIIWYYVSTQKIHHAMWCNVHWVYSNFWEPSIWTLWAYNWESNFNDWYGGKKFKGLKKCLQTDEFL